MAEHLTLKGETFERRRLRDSGAELHDADLVRCTFSNCHVIPSEPWEPPTMRAIFAKGATVKSCSLTRCRIMDVVVDGLKCQGGPLFIEGCALKHVVLKGRVGPILFRHADPEQPSDLAKWYASVDWALDISEAMLTDIDLQAIPAPLVRRDSATQALVTRENVEGSGWREIVPRGTLSGVYIEDMLAGDSDSCIIVAPKGNKKRFARTLDEIEALRAAGIADPD